MSIRFSVIIPVYNGEKYLKEAINSVLAQTYTNYEIIAVDDGSIDSSIQVLRSYGEKVKWISQQNAGVAAARNRAIEMSTGEWIALLDHDDLWLSEKLALQADLISRNAGIGLTWGGAVRFKGPPPVSPQNTWEYHAERLHYHFKDLLIFNKIAALTTVFSKEAFLKAGRFDASVNGADDWDLWIRIASTYPIKYLPKTVALYRLHEGQTIRNTHKMTLEELRVVQKNKNIYMGLSGGKQLYWQELSKRLSNAAMEAIKAGQRTLAFKLSIEGFFCVGTAHRLKCLKVLTESILGTRTYDFLSSSLKK